MRDILSTIVCTLAAWGAASAMFAGLLLLAWDHGPAQIGAPSLSFWQAFAFTSCLGLLVGVVRFAWTAPLIRVAAKYNSFSDKRQGWEWVTTVWPPRGK